MDSIRIDVWLDVACLFRTRSEAQRACKGGKVDVNGEAARPHRLVGVGDEIVITRRASSWSASKQRVIVRAVADRHIAKPEARQLYEDRTPPPSPQEIELRRMERLGRQLVGSARVRTPDRRERRELRRLKERG